MNLRGLNKKTSEYITGKEEFLELYNFDFSQPGSLTKRPGTVEYLGATVQGRITGLYEYEKLNGSSYLIATANTNAYRFDTSSFSSIKTGLTSGALFDFVTFLDTLFAANGSEIFKYNGQSTYPFSMPQATGLTGNASGTGSGWTGTFVYKYGYLSDIGSYGPCSDGFTRAIGGASLVSLSGFTTPSGYGITSLVIYRTSQDNLDFFEIGTLPAGGATFLDTFLPQGINSCPDTIFFTLAPKYMDIYQNRMILAGFSATPSTFWVSETGQPESFQATSFIEVRTNDGDLITGLKSYLSNLMVFKQKSFHALTGDNFDNFLLREISDQYGCLSNRAVATFEDLLFFLDEKGIVQFNGANVEVISTPIEEIFLKMNVNAAKENAVAIHNRLRNEIWFGIPCNGSTTNNCTIVYDYVVQAFTVFDGFSPSSLAIMKGANTTDVAFYGSYSGSVHHFGESLFSDNGQGFTCLAQSRYIGEMGKSVTEQYRRLYLDINPEIGQTATIDINFRQDYGSSIVLSREMYSTPFQSRIDFGIPAKSLSTEFSNYSTLPIQIHGFTLESRFQRNT